MLPSGLLDKVAIAQQTAVQWPGSGHRHALAATSQPKQLVKRISGEKVQWNWSNDLNTLADAVYWCHTIWELQSRRFCTHGLRVVVWRIVAAQLAKDDEFFVSCHANEHRRTPAHWSSIIMNESKVADLVAQARGGMTAGLSSLSRKISCGAEDRRNRRHTEGAGWPKENARNTQSLPRRAAKETVLHGWKHSTFPGVCFIW